MADDSNNPLKTIALKYHSIIDNQLWPTNNFAAYPDFKLQELKQIIKIDSETNYICC